MSIFNFHLSDQQKLTLVKIWILIVIALIFATVIVGGATRLTESGLSIVEWKPISGILPPLSSAEWHEVFDQYRSTPQYQMHNEGMSLSDFKFIFLWEYSHRVLARLIGLVFGIPLLLFTLAGWFKMRFLLKLYGILILGGLQGALGWYMVKSGLVDIPRVSHLRLAAHLSVALITMCLLIWIYAGISLQKSSSTLQTKTTIAPLSLRILLSIALPLVFIQIIWGAFTAGLRAGYLYNTFPLMHGYLIPPGMGTEGSLLMDLTFNVITVQFVHRMFAWLLLALTIAICYFAMYRFKVKHLRTVTIGFVSIVFIQFSLGVLTLLTSVNIFIAVAHQGFATLLLGITTVFFYKVFQHNIERLRPLK